MRNLKIGDTYGKLGTLQVIKHLLVVGVEGSRERMFIFYTDDGVVTMKRVRD